MKLANPSDEELNYAFAYHVAKWTKDFKPTSERHWLVFGWKDAYGKSIEKAPWFTDSADAVLPWLEQHYLEAQYWPGHAGERPCWRIGVEGQPTSDRPGHWKDKSFARTAVISLLLANGVDVEFTQ